MATTPDAQVFIVFILTFSNDGVNAIPGLTRISQPIVIDVVGANVTNKSIVSTAKRLRWYIPELDAKYMKVSWGVVGSDIVTQWSLGATQVYIEPVADSEVSNEIDIG